MATIYVTEYARFAGDSGGRAMNVGQEPAVNEQQQAIGGASAALPQAFDTTTRLIRVQADANCRIAIGTSPTASSASKRLVAGATEYFGVRGGDNLAVISGS